MAQPTCPTVCAAAGALHSRQLQTDFRARTSAQCLPSGPASPVSTRSDKLACFTTAVRKRARGRAQSTVRQRPEGNSASVSHAMTKVLHNSCASSSVLLGVNLALILRTGRHQQLTGAPSLNRSGLLPAATRWARSVADSDHSVVHL
jgi:hypothetical protein